MTARFSCRPVLFSAIASSSWRPACRSRTVVPAGPARDAMNEFLTRWRAKHGDRDPNAGARAWDSMMLIAKAVEAAKSVEGPAVRDAIEQLPTYQGAFTAFAFSPEQHVGNHQEPLRDRARQERQARRGRVRRDECHVPSPAGCPRNLGTLRPRAGAEAHQPPRRGGRAGHDPRTERGRQVDAAARHHPADAGQWPGDVPRRGYQPRCRPTGGPRSASSWCRKAADCSAR